MDLRPTSAYVRELKPLLAPAVFERAWSRVLWLPAHLALIALVIVAIASGWLPWLLVPAASLVLGVSYAGITFLAHETLHGGVVRSRAARRAVGWIGFMPFLVSPRLWMLWHNREHHGKTNQRRIDPDMYPELPEYQASRVIRVVTDRFALGARRWTGILSLLVGFTGQSSQMLIYARGRLGMPARDHRIAWAETGLGIAVWTAIAILVGPLAFLFVYVLPLIVANWIVMAYILTNHNLSRGTPVNDPLANSLSVTVPRVAEWLSLGFGYHVEHHLFPAMSTRHAPHVRALLLEKWPERYQSMPLGEALLRLHRTARVYQDDLTLCDPRSGAVFPTLSLRSARSSRSSPG